MQNLFDILGLPAAYALNEAVLEKAYFAAQRACHPDGFVGKGAAERLAAITRSQAVNDAYETLKDPITRAQHLLMLQDISTLGENDKAPPALLMEQMELREALEEASGEGAALAHVVEDIKKGLSESNKQLVSAFEASDYHTAASALQRLHYLNKAMEEAHMRIYRLKAQA